MKQIPLLLFALACVSLVFSLQPPFWGSEPTYTVTVNLTNPDPKPLTKWQFNYYYDATVKSERYEHFPPQFDEMCQDLPVKDWTSQQCNVIFATDGWSYLQYPSIDFCCKCASKFGAVRYDWLQENSTFVGLDVKRGLKVEHWEKAGQYMNHYYATVEGRLPVIFNELVRGDLKQWDFLLDTYKVGKFNRSLIEPPPGCTNLCTSWPCREYRLRR